MFARRGGCADGVSMVMPTMLEYDYGESMRMKNDGERMMVSIMTVVQVAVDWSYESEKSERTEDWIVTAVPIKHFWIV